MTDDDLKTISKNSFKNIIKNKATNATLKYLNEAKVHHSKLENLHCSELMPQTYFTDSRLTSNEVKLLFKLRTRMFECKNNFKNQYRENLFCNLCKVSVDSQRHLLECFVLRNCVPELRKNKIKYEFIFEDIEHQVEAIRLLYKIVNIREVLLDKLVP